MSLLDRLRGRRTAEAKGKLSLDRAKARQKLREFRLPDPHMYVVQFVRAASILGASQVAFDITATELVCRFDATIREDLVRDLWAAAFEERTDAQSRAAHVLALGLGSAQALRPKFIAVESGGQRIVYTDRGEEPADAPEFDEPGTVIHVVEKFRLGHVVAWITSIEDGFAEAEALVRLCSHASFQITVNGRRVLRDPRLVEVERWEQHEDSKSWVAPVGQVPQIDQMSMQQFLASSETHVSRFVLTKDGVDILLTAPDYLSVRTLGVLEHFTLGTDLSGLAPHDRSIALGVFHQSLVPMLHRRQREQLDQLDLTEQLAVLSDAFHYLRLYAPADEPSAELRRLIDTLCERPMFRTATGQPRDVSLNEARQDGVVRIATEEFPEQTDGPPTLHVPETDTFLSRARRDAITASRQAKQFRVHDVTDLCRQAENTRRGAKLFEARREHPLPDVPYFIDVEAGQARARVYLAYATGPGHSRLRALEGLFFCADHKLVRRQQDDLALSVQFDGPFKPNAAFDDIERDEQFDALVIEVMLATLPLYQAFADKLRGTSARAIPDPLWSYVRDIVQGGFVYSFQRRVGYSVDAAREQRSAYKSKLWPLYGRRDRSVDQTMDHLGTLARIRGIERATGAPWSLQEAVSRDDLSVIVMEKDWHARLQRLKNDYPVGLLQGVALVTEDQEAILRTLRGNLVKAEEAIERAIELQSFMAKPPYEVALPPQAIDARTQWTSGLASYELLFVPHGQDGFVEVALVWRERLLGKRRVPVDIGSFFAVIRSEDLMPNQAYNDAVDTEHLQRMLVDVTAAVPGALEQWWTAKLRDPPWDGGPGRLFQTLSFERAFDDRGRRCLQVARPGVDEWTHDLASVDELLACASTNGGILPYAVQSVRTAPVGLADPDTPVLLVGGSGSVDQLQGLFGDLQFTDHTKREVWEQNDHRVFMNKPTVGGPLENAVVGQHEGVTFETALSLRRDKPSNAVSVVWSDRVLESVEVAVPFGHFRSLVRGEAFTPDANYRFVAGGRNLITTVATHSAAAVVRAVCDERPAHLESTIRWWLAQSTTLELSAPFDLVDELEAAVRAYDERRLSAMSQEFEEVAPDDSSTDDVNALLLKLGAPQAVSVPVEAVGALQDELLYALSQLLTAARGERRDLFDDEMALSLCWVEEASQRLCEVDAQTIGLDRAHPLVARAEDGDLMAQHAVASVVYTAINAHYGGITDLDELQMQAALMRSPLK